jgi:hypothetical protein
MQVQNSSVVIVGIGELGSLFAKGALKSGCQVIPVRREDDLVGRVEATNEDTPILLSVGEADMGPVIERLPTKRKQDVILVQNELFPTRWNPYVERPTVSVVWTAAKPGIPLMVGKETVTHGKHAQWFTDIHEPLGLNASVADSEVALHGELAAKYAFILTINVLGLRHDVTVGELFSEHQSEAEAVLDDGLRLAEVQLGESFDRTSAMDSVRRAASGLSEMPAKGRSAAKRLDRALELASSHDITVDRIQEIAKE